MSHVVFVAGSPSESSRSSFVASALAAHVSREGLDVRTFSLRDFEPGDLIFGRSTAPAVAGFVSAVSRASAIVLSTPVYKGTIAGGLKSIVDLIPADALAGRVALGVATARQPAHGDGVSRAYRDLFAFFRTKALDTLFVADDELVGLDGKPELSTASSTRLAQAALALVAASRAVGGPNG
jgi:FMN reductase